MARHNNHANQQRNRNQSGDQSQHKMGPKEAGAKGGEATAETHDHQFYQNIGQDGGNARKQELGHEGYVELGQKGGEATAESHDHDFYEDIGREGGSAPHSKRGNHGQGEKSNQ